MKYYKLIINDPKSIKEVKNDLDRRNKLNKAKKIEKIEGKSIIYTLFEESEPVPYNLPYDIYEYTVINDNLESTIRHFYQKIDVGFKEDLVQYIPKKWIIYEPMILFNSETLDASIWDEEFKKYDKTLLFEAIAKYFKVSHIAINKPIVDDNVMRIPTNINPIYGDFGPPVDLTLLTKPTKEDFDGAFWCSTVQNGIHQTWAPRFTMFSRGNIKEKKRLLDTFKNLNKTWVFDLYAGIGYFTLSYLKNGGKVVCFELNPWSIEALKRNCIANGFKFKIGEDIIDDDTQVFIFNETNELALHRFQRSAPISHINLGLLPSSVQSWETTNKILQLSTIPTYIHVHENVHIDEFNKFEGVLLDYFPCEFKDLVKVKTFAPDVWHIVVDLISLH